MRRLARDPLLVAVAALLLASAAASGKSTDRQQAMDIAADRTDALLGDDSDSTLYGNVRITQGTLEVDADKAVIHRKGGDITQVVLTGAPATMKQVADNGEPMTARARQIVYTLSSDIIVLSGDVLIEQPRGHLRGQTVKYDLKSGRLDGGGDGNRVQMRILPKTGSGGSPD